MNSRFEIKLSIPPTRPTRRYRTLTANCIAMRSYTGILWPCGLKLDHWPDDVDDDPLEFSPRSKAFAFRKALPAAPLAFPTLSKPYCIGMVMRHWKGRIGGVRLDRRLPHDDANSRGEAHGVGIRTFTDGIE